MIDEDIDATLRAAIECFTTSANRDRVDLPISIDYSAHILIAESRLAGWIAGCDATISVWCEASETVKKAGRKILNEANRQRDYWSGNDMKQ